MTPLSPGDKLAGPPPRLPADHPGVNELFAVLAYGEVVAFYRLTEEAKMAPDLRGRISMVADRPLPVRPRRGARRSDQECQATQPAGVVVTSSAR